MTHEHTTWNEELEARLAAYALGEVDGEKSEQLAELALRDERAARFVADTRAVAEELAAALAAEGAQGEAGLTPTQRAAVTSTAAGLSQVGRLKWLKQATFYGGLACAAGLAGVIGVSMLQRESLAPGAESADVATLAAPTYMARQGNAAGRPAGNDTLYLLDFDTEVAQGAALAPGTPVADLGSVTLGGLAHQGEAPEESFEEAEVAQSDAPKELLDELEEPTEPSNTEGYEHIVENPFVSTRLDTHSTFSIDVDPASYSNVRRMLRDGTRVPPDAVRIEELVNYFPYRYERPAPGDARPFTVHVDVADAPWQPRHRLVRIGLAAAELDLSERPRANLVFLLDVSGSMDDPQKLPLVKRALALLVEQLGDDDSVAIVVYAGAEGLALPATLGAAREAILQSLERLQAGGSTNGGAGLRLAYRTARGAFLEGGLNRVILCTDGDFNVGETSDGDLERLITDEAKSGVFLTVLGFGSGNWQDAKMEKLSNRGNGNFAYIDSLAEARKVLVEELGGTLATVAKDVKVQVEFNPAEVQAARLIGYENRVLAHQDFLDDQKDAGEIGAGHRVTALYEVIPVGVPYEAPAVPESKYTGERSPSGAAASGELLTVRLRYKAPDGDTSTGFEVPVRDTGTRFHEADDDLRFAASVAAFGMVLRGSAHVGTTGFDDVRQWALEALGEDAGGYREGFLELVELARAAAERRR
jgi:Ca-activated chloride channel family protein